MYKLMQKDMAQTFFRY